MSSFPQAANPNGKELGFDDIQPPPYKKFKSHAVEIEQPIAIILDIEGTTTKKSFYSSTLLPYSIKNFREFLYNNYNKKYVSKRIQNIKNEYFKERNDKQDAFNKYFNENQYQKYLENQKQKQKQKQINDCNDMDYMHDIKQDVLNGNNDNKMDDNDIKEAIVIQDDDPDALDIIDITKHKTQQNTLNNPIVINDNDNDNDTCNASKSNIIDLDDNDDKPITNVIRLNDNDDDTHNAQNGNIIDLDKDDNDVIRLNDDDDDDQDIDLLDLTTNNMQILGENKKNNPIKIHQNDDDIDDNDDEDDDLIQIQHNCNDNQDIDIDVNNNNDDDDVYDVYDDYSSSIVLSKSEFYKSIELDYVSGIISEYFSCNYFNISLSKSIQYLQGLVILDGFNSSALFGHVYSDVYNRIIEWSESDSIFIYIYSSGSSSASSLLFSNTIYGNLNEFISDYFSKLNYGNKKNTQSYLKIFDKIKIDYNNITGDTIDDEQIEDILFISDNSKELRAAQMSGMSVIQCNRNDCDDNDNQGNNINNVDLQFEQIDNFNQIYWI